MTLLDEAKTNGHAEPATRAWDARFARIERRLAEITESGEQRIVVLRDAIAEFAAAELAQRDDEIRILKKNIADLENRLAQKTAVDQQVAEIATRLDARQLARDEARRGPQGLRGLKGDRGERGAPGKKGISEVRTVKIKTWLVNTENFTITAITSDGTPAPALDLRPLFQKFLDEIWSWQ